MFVVVESRMVGRFVEVAKADQKLHQLNYMKATDVIAVSRQSKNASGFPSAASKSEMSGSCIPNPTSRISGRAPLMQSFITGRSMTLLQSRYRSTYNFILGSLAIEVILNVNAEISCGFTPDFSLYTYILRFPINSYLGQPQRTAYWGADFNGLDIYPSRMVPSTPR